jgi:hypothetical protein
MQTGMMTAGTVVSAVTADPDDMSRNVEKEAPTGISHISDTCSSFTLRHSRIDRLQPVVLRQEQQPLCRTVLGQASACRMRHPIPSHPESARHKPSGGIWLEYLALASLTIGDVLLAGRCLWSGSLRQAEAFDG